MRLVTVFLFACFVPVAASAVEPPVNAEMPQETMVVSNATATRLAQNYSCTPARTCKAIASCEEARWYLQNCPWGGKLDRDRDGHPCESGPC
ncbi:MAG: excalibur calcium-binding domain-containing protein [Pannonibacter sp.]